MSIADPETQEPEDNMSEDSIPLPRTVRVCCPISFRYTLFKLEGVLLPEYLIDAQGAIMLSVRVMTHPQ